MAALAAMPALADWSGPPGSSSGGGGVTVGAAISGTCPNGDVLFSSAGVIACEVVSGTGTVTGVSWAGGIITITNPTTTPAFTIAGTSGGVPYFSSASTWASSGLLSANALMIGGGAGAAPSTTTTGAGVLTALGAAVNATTGLPNVDGAITTGDCLMWGPGVQDAGAACGSGGGGIAPPPASVTNKNQLYPMWGGITTAAGGAAPTQNTARCTPFITPAQHWDELIVDVTTLGTGPLAFALYTDAIDATTGIHQPQTPITGGNGSWTVTGAGVLTAALGTAGTGIAIPLGMSWFCYNDTNSADVVRFNTWAAASPVLFASLVGITSPGNPIATTQFTSLTTAEASGTWPSFAGVAFVASNVTLVPMIAERVVSVP